LTCILDQASGASLRWQAQGDGGPLKAPTLLCARLPDARARAALEHVCQSAHIMTRRWYQPLLSDMAVLRSRCLKMPVPNADALAQSLLGVPFFLGMDIEMRQRLHDAVVQALA